MDGISTPQTLNIEGYIKKKKEIVLIDFGSTHNFIPYKLAKDLNCFVYPAPEFQVMIADGGTINFSGKCNKINLTMGEYVVNSPMISIPMGGADVVLGIQWLQSNQDKRGRSVQNHPYYSLGYLDLRTYAF